MKIYQGKYTTWFGPYQLAEFLCFWAKDEKDEYGFKHKPDWVHDFGEYLAHGKAKDETHLPRSLRSVSERPTTLLYRFLVWIDSFKKRKIKIRIDDWDTWSVTNLTMIILPYLKRVHSKKQGAPFIDDSDVPEELRSTNAPPKKDEWDTDDNWFKRYDWVIEEIIWTFEQLQPDYDWESQYTSGEHDMYMEPCKFKEDGKPALYEMKKGPDDTFKIDHEGRDKHQARIDNGLRLFGKYFQSLAT